MLTRRQILRSVGVLGVAATASPLLDGCGTSHGRPIAPVRAGSSGVARANQARYLGGAPARPAAIAAVRAFTTDLYQQIASSRPGNVVCSPYSVAVALAMTLNGARGKTAAEMRAVLHAPDLERFNEGMDSLALLLESRTGEQKRLDGSKANVSLDVANSLWGQHGEAWEQPFLGALARYYGAGMRLVNYERDPDAARIAINTWTSVRTHAKIPHLLPEGVIDGLTRLVLVNAIYLKAPWEMPFAKAKTKNRPFTLSDGRTISTKTMEDRLSVVITHGSGWRAVRLPYAGRKLALTVVVPSFSLVALEHGMDADRLQEILGSTGRPQSVTLRMPTWKFRLSSPLNDALIALGMPTAFSAEADLSGMTLQEGLYVKAVQHEAFIAVDEHGTEAAAATAVVAEALSAQAPPPVFEVDRPFLFVLHDVDTAAPLFIGRVTDPRAS